MAAGPRASAEVTIVNQRGLHARAAARFVKTAQAFAAEVTVSRDGVSVPGTSMLGLMMLAAGPGTTLALAAEGEDAEAALAALAALVASGFGES